MRFAQPISDSELVDEEVNLMKLAKIAILIGFCLAPASCLVVDHERVDCYGDYCDSEVGNIGFWWSFELPDGSVTDSCGLAEVARVDVRVYNDWGDLEFASMDRPCGDLGLDLFDFVSGWYSLQLTGRCNRGVITHDGYYDLWVGGGQNEFGVLVLDYLGPCW
jgi:hypothetical protein